jgi:group II intron reverse transcriptase/maturase
MKSTKIDFNELWRTLPWKKFRRSLFRLQVRLYKAARANDILRVRNLQKLILRSQAARFLAIRQVTQLNHGKKTAGIDGKKSLTFKERFLLSDVLKDNIFHWVHLGLKEHIIPKKDGTTRTLKIPTMKDRAWQKLVLYALEPAHEAHFHKNSFGFRSGRSAHDAQKYLYSCLKSTSNGITKRVLELDIEKCFDRIDHNDLMNRVIAPQSIKTGLWKCLKAGINVDFPDQGTPQGGIISPLLANISLNGVEKIGEYIFSSYNKKVREGKKFETGKDRLYICTRYADDMVFLLDPDDDAEAIMEEIKQFLAVRGLNIKAAKTRLVKSTEGFDFLGWHFRVRPNGKFISYPSKANYQALRQKVKDIVNNSRLGAEAKTKKLAPIIRGWRNYHKHCDMRKHGLWGLSDATFKRFNKEKKMNRYKAKELILKAFPKVSWKVNKFVQVEGIKSPFDGDIHYWSERNSKLYDGLTAKLLKKQGHKCSYCGYKFQTDEIVHLHHIDGNHNNWKTKNITVVHESCHDYIHSGKSRKG